MPGKSALALLNGLVEPMERELSGPNPNTSTRPPEAGPVVVSGSRLVLNRLSRGLDGAHIGCRAVQPKLAVSKGNEAKVMLVRQSGSQAEHRRLLNHRLPSARSQGADSLSQMSNGDGKDKDANSTASHESHQFVSYTFGHQQQPSGAKTKWLKLKLNRK